MTQMTSDEYVAKKGSTCPFCGSTELVGAEVNIEDGEAHQEVGCDKCGNTWTDRYALIGFSPMEDE